ncbi:DUF2889 domain-containing protein [Novosphingobium sp. AP12]|uniref:DUF2889 domain-containing protein n=1 Tax=Novosphingobium sp. AP12 TaxID=1144305 RepID=UPI0002721A20|nr:DUF2889 domain-containing protein [Novosphingobium sp. AP12]EJL24750.1 Protein of unknown function (DUF2889) [Novosphingobium sp. AP12]
MIACAVPDVFTVPGYRRVIRIEPGDGRIRALLEDDLHAMVVELRHAGERVTGIDAYMDRIPWTTCPGAERVLRDTFIGLPLAEVTARRDKQANCTHLHDLAVLAAAHAGDTGPSEYTFAVSDPCRGERILEVRRNGATVQRWTEQDGMLTEPEALTGQSLLTLRDWIGGLSGAPQEAARMLQWAGLVAHGRTLSDTDKHAALFHRPSCFTMQPGNVEHAEKAAPTKDFSSGAMRPLDGLRERFELSRS